jgi:hypothetical protein
MTINEQRIDRLRSELSDIEFESQQSRRRCGAVEADALQGAHACSVAAVKGDERNDTWQESGTYSQVASGGSQGGKDAQGARRWPQSGSDAQTPRRCTEGLGNPAKESQERLIAIRPMPRLSWRLPRSPARLIPARLG